MTVIFQCLEGSRQDGRRERRAVNSTVHPPEYLNLVLLSYLPYLTLCEAIFIYNSPAIEV